jgi:NAD(P)-dependent dehydrogenase (short-subunit alcohol dehydrogenase family)
MNVKGQAVIVTGGASGLGGATASALAAAGAKVAIFDVQDELGEKKAKELGGTVGKDGPHRSSPTSPGHQHQPDRHLQHDPARRGRDGQERAERRTASAA